MVWFRILGLQGEDLGLDGLRVQGCRVSGLRALEITVEARKLEHQHPHALKVEYRGS